MTGARSPILRIAWILAGATCLFTAENIWIDPWLAKKSHHRLPSFVPEALGGVWLFVSMSLTIAVILIVVCQVLLMRDAKIAAWKKGLTGLLALAAMILAGEWFVATGGMKLVERSSPPQKRTVTLRWQASTTPKVRYNVYRGPTPGIHLEKLNAAPLDALTFTDTTVENGSIYYYVVRAVDAGEQESRESNEVAATIP